MPDSTAPFTTSLAKSLERLFKVGGFALTFGFSGLLLVVIASFSNTSLRLPMFIVGVLTFICLFFFLFTNLRAKRAAERLKDDLPLLDVLQRAALQVTELASITQSLVFKHLTRIQSTIETVAPVIETLPVIGQRVKRAGLTDSVRLSAIIVTATDGTKEVVLGLHQAIRSGDIRAVQKYSRQLETAVADLKLALKEDQTPNSSSSGRESATADSRLQHDVRRHEGYTMSVDDLS